jgi:hypothetical protein
MCEYIKKKKKKKKKQSRSKEGLYIHGLREARNKFMPTTLTTLIQPNLTKATWPSTQTLLQGTKALPHP